MKKKQLKVQKEMVFGIALVVVLVLTVVLLWRSLIPRETKTSEVIEPAQTAILICKTSKPTDPVVKSGLENALSRWYEVRLSFAEEKLNAASLIITESYKDETEAKLAQAELSASYYTYLQSRNVSVSSLAPNFNTIDSEVIGTFTLQQKDFSSVTLPLIFLSSSDEARLSSYSIATLKKAYQTKNFSCNYGE